jgi:hypothetical protein
MILNNRRVIVLLVGVTGIYGLIYLGTLTFGLFDIDNLTYIKYFVWCLLIISPLATTRMISRGGSIFRLFYIIFATFLILFFVSSIFVFKISDIFFWNDNRDRAEAFFAFSYWMLGVNYVLFMPYVFLVFVELIFLGRRRNIQ